MGTEVADLTELINMLREQGADWDGWFEVFEGGAGGHNVNNAQGIKSSAVWYRYSANETMHTLAKRRMQNLDSRYGLPTGMYNGDELLPSPATRNPSRGIELCGVVEAMFSYTTLFSTHGDVEFADRAERIAYNALPATWASPTGGDMCGNTMTTWQRRTVWSRTMAVARPISIKVGPSSLTCQSSRAKQMGVLLSPSSHQC